VSSYRDVLKSVMELGSWEEPRSGVRALTLMQQTMSYDLDEGFPLVTERDMSAFWRKPIGELCAFINGATTIKELESFGCDWWGPWATEEKTAKRGLEAGSLGPGSYGGAFRFFPSLEDPEGFDQFAHLVEQIRELPRDRTHIITPWIPQYLSRAPGRIPRATIAPCHGWVHVRVLSGRLHLHLFQRSGDLPVGVPSNMVQYAALLLMLEHLTGIEAGVFHHTISDAHIYEDQIPAVEEMLSREPRPLPTAYLDLYGRGIRDIHDFRAEHFDIADYDPHPALKVPVTV